MKIKWDYSELAQNYNKRPNYSQSIINELIHVAGLNKNSKVCDIGAGTGYLSQLLAPHVETVSAVEPNINMRLIGMKSNESISNINWFPTNSEYTGLDGDLFDLVSYGSSFNVVDQKKSLIEAERISRKNGWFLAIWNHRDLKTPLQNEIEVYIKSQIPKYTYGNRRQDQTALLKKSSMFSQIQKFEEPMTVTQHIDDVKAAWHSHATLQKQAKSKFRLILNGIDKIIEQNNSKIIDTQYVSRAWLAQFKR